MTTNADILAAKISEAARKFSWLEQLDPASKQEPSDQNAIQAILAGSSMRAARTTQVQDDAVSVASRGNASVISRDNLSVASRGNASVGSRASSKASNHDVSDMEPMEILEMAKSLVTLPYDARIFAEASQQQERTHSTMAASTRSCPVPPRPLDEEDDDDDDVEEDFEDPFARDENESNRRERNDVSTEVLLRLANALLAEEEGPLQRQQRRRGKDASRRANGKSKRGKRRNPRRQQQTSTQSSVDDVTVHTDSSSYKSPRSVCSSTIPSDSELLAKGWKKAFDESCGKYYYYTMDHSQVIWENPLESNDDWFSTDDEKDAFMGNPFADEEDDPFALDPFDLVDGDQP